MRFFAILSVLFELISGILLLSCRPHTDTAQTELAMGTVCAIDLFDSSGKAKALYTRLFERLRQIEAEFSVNIADSAVSRVNANAGIAPVNVSDDFLRVLDCAMDIAKKCENDYGFAAFNPALGPLIQLWGIGTEDERVPAAHEISAALKLCDIKKVKIDKNAKTVFLSEAGMALDLGGIVKGFAADELVKMIDIGIDTGIGVGEQSAKTKPAALLNLGGNVYVHGKKKTHFFMRTAAWRIGVRNTQETIELFEGSVVTSGTYERFFEQDGVRYHHILDARTGASANTGAESVTVICNNSMLADALSTTVFVLGEKDGRDFVRAYFPEASVITVNQDGTVNRN